MNNNSDLNRSDTLIIKRTAFTKTEKKYLNNLLTSKIDDLNQCLKLSHGVMDLDEEGEILDEVYTIDNIIKRLNKDIFYSACYSTELEISKKKAIQLHRDLWHWLYKNPGYQKYHWPRWTRMGGNVPMASAHCFACEYAKQFVPPNDPEYDLCVHCPFVWPDAGGCYPHDSNGKPTGLYHKWCSTKSLGEKMILAKQIRDLPVRPDKTACEFVGGLVYGLWTCSFCENDFTNEALDWEHCPQCGTRITGFAYEDKNKEEQ